MSSDGKQLESLVAFVEEKLLPPGFQVKSNERVFNDEGVQIAEFDIEIRGKVGTTTIAWLIECRDRPGHGAAPGSWIEQLVGRKTRFGFNKVTAVSTTGFAAGAITFAREQGIELRDVRSLDQTEFADWLHISAMRQIRRVAELKHAALIVHPNESEAAKIAALKTIAGVDGSAAVLISSSTSESVNLSQAFLGAVQSLQDAFDGVSVGTPLPIRLVSEYLENDYYVVDTQAGRVRIQKIDFTGELRIEETDVPIVKTTEYSHTETGEVISQLAAFAPQSILDMKLALEMHRMADTGETHIVMRRLPDDAKPAG